MITRNKLYFFVIAMSMAGLGWVALNLFTDSGLPFGCLFHKITTLPCPACGATRSAMSLFRGEIANALYYNPIGIILVIVGVLAPLWIIGDLIGGSSSFWRAYCRTEIQLRKTRFAIPAIILLIINWGWLFYKKF